MGRPWRCEKPVGTRRRRRRGEERRRACQRAGGKLAGEAGGVRLHLSREKIVGVVSWSDLDGAGAKRHVDQHRVAYDGYAAADEGMHEELAVQVRVARVLGVHRNGSVAQHGFETRGCNYDFIVAALDFVREFNEDAKLVRAVAVARHALALRLFELFGVDFNVGDGAFEGACRERSEKIEGARRLCALGAGGCEGGAQSQLTRRLAL